MYQPTHGATHRPAPRTTGSNHTRPTNHTTDDNLSQFNSVTMSTTDDSNMDTSQHAIDNLVGEVDRALLEAQQRQQAARRDHERQERANAAKAEADRNAAARPPPSAEPVEGAAAQAGAHTGLSPSIAGMGFAFQPPEAVVKGANLHQASRRTGRSRTFSFPCT